MNATEKVTHTSGPWDAYVTDDGFSVFRNEGGHSGDHIMCITDDPESLMNARLIAAAPDLLASLKSLHSWLGGRCVEGDTIGSLQRMLADASRAIKKAEGK